VNERYRLAEDRDLAPIVSMLTDSEVGRWLWFTPGTPEMFETFFAPLIEAQTREIATGAEPNNAVFVVEDGDGAFLGQGAALPVDGSPDGFEIGFQLTRAAWGRGVGTRLGQYVCAYAIHQRDAYRVEGACLEGNLGSRKILEGLGLRLEGTRTDYRLRDGVRHTELLYGARASDLDHRETARHFGWD
jgi:RimJ/RimL family protein N-acetyltransferase